jgi:hypothetical protein
MEIAPDPGPLLAAAIVAALTRLEDEANAAAAVPATRPVKGRWVASGLPREVLPPLVHRPTPTEHPSRGGSPDGIGARG